MTTFSLSNPCQTLPVPDHFILVYLYKVMTTGQNVTVHMSSLNTGTLGIKKKKKNSFFQSSQKQVAILSTLQVLNIPSSPILPFTYSFLSHLIVELGDLCTLLPTAFNPYKQQPLKLYNRII